MVRLSAAACARVVGLPCFAEARHVIVYAPIGNELDPGAIAERAIVCGKSVYYPAPEQGQMAFRRSGNGSPRVAEAESARLDPAAEEVVFVVPGVAFDPRGVRLGRGYGWYDRAFARYPAGVRLGFAYEFQMLPRVPEAPWDVRMHAVVTDARVIHAAAVTGQYKENPR